MTHRECPIVTEVLRVAVESVEADPECLHAQAVGEAAPGPLSRREFLETLGAGLLITVSADEAWAQRRGGGGGSRGGAATVRARLHLDPDGTFTVFTGKVELGQGARTQITQAAAEELRVGADRVRLVMGDTDLVPDDGITAGSRTTPSTIPVVRKATATARRLLAELAAKQWGVDAASVEVRDGTIADRDGRRKLSYAELAKAPDLAQALASSIPDNVELTPREAWKVLGTSLPRPNARDLVTGEHRFPSDIVHPGMLYGVVLRPPSYGATLESIDLSAAKAMAGVVAVREGEFVAFAAPTRHAAAAALEAAAKTASWKVAPHPSSKELFAHLKQHARGGEAPAADAAKSSKTLTASYEVAYIQHVPMEPRAAVAQWNEGKVTVWTGTQNPMGVWGEVASALGLPRQQVRVIVPDSGGGFGGKHTNSAAVEAARLARAAGKPVCVRWSREEEFTWAYFRPAALIQIRGGLDGQGKLVAWDFVNINSGGAAVDSPYDVAKKNCRFVGSDAPLRQSSYRALAATANNFAREAFMDELAAAAGSDPLAFRLAHLSNDRLRAVLEEAAKRFGWAERVARKVPNRGVGLACGTEKGSFVAACVEIEVDRKQGRIVVERICEVFECGAIQNPNNLLSQVQGCIVMGLGGALTEAIEFEGGKVLNASFKTYQVPRFKDVPQLDLHLLDRRDLPSVGGGETPIIAVAPAIANAVCNATGVRLRAMPIRGEKLKEG